ncbi:mechanosensitive ion channel family protein [Candidatus Parcubacteria bacterium]|nr:mechanosensitive ion channel family protein [Candidatus Parcubacteria bacterium]
MDYFVSNFADLFPEQNFEQDLVVFKLFFAVIAALLAAYGINRVINRLLPKIAQRMAPVDKKMRLKERIIMRRRTETLLLVAAAIGRALVVAAALYIAFRLLNPTNAPVALIGASTVFFIIGLATIGPLLRDLTSGVIMIAEKWYNVGDYVVVDPFWELGGVVEKVNLRSTKLRALSGEVIWIHNQHIQAVRVIEHGLRTMSVDTFVSDLEKGRKLINDVLPTMPTGPTMITKPMKIIEEDQLGEIWRITAEGQTSPGREWLIEDFVVKAIEKSDSKLEESVIIHGPIVRYTDMAAEARFLTSMSNT